MSEPAADAPLAAGVRWLAGARVTLGAVALLLVVFAAELAVWWRFGARAWEFVFLADLEPTPGWVLSPFAHRSVTHLAGSLSVIVVYGSLLERRLSAKSYAAFLVGAGYASTLAQLASYLNGQSVLGTLGASGAALGLAALFGTAVALDVRSGAEVTAIERLFALTAAVVAAVVVANDFLPGVAIASGTAPLGHLGGLAAGVGYGPLAQTGSAGAPSEGL